MTETSEVEAVLLTENEDGTPKHVPVLLSSEIDGRIILARIESISPGCASKIERARAFEGCRASTVVFFGEGSEMLVLIPLRFHGISKSSLVSTILIMLYNEATQFGLCPKVEQVALVGLEDVG